MKIKLMMIVLMLFTLHIVSAFSDTSFSKANIFEGATNNFVMEDDRVIDVRVDGLDSSLRRCRIAVNNKDIGWMEEGEERDTSPSMRVRIRVVNDEGCEVEVSEIDRGVVVFDDVVSEIGGQIFLDEYGLGNGITVLGDNNNKVSDNEIIKDCYIELTTGYTSYFLDPYFSEIVSIGMPRRISNVVNNFKIEVSEVFLQTGDFIFDDKEISNPKSCHITITSYGVNKEKPKISIISSEIVGSIPDDNFGDTVYSNSDIEINSNYINEFSLNVHTTYFHVQDGKEYIVRTEIESDGYASRVPYVFTFPYFGDFKYYWKGYNGYSLYWPEDISKQSPLINFDTTHLHNLDGRYFDRITGVVDLEPGINVLEFPVVFSNSKFEEALFYYYDLAKKTSTFGYDPNKPSYKEPDPEMFKHNFLRRSPSTFILDPEEIKITSYKPMDTSASNYYSHYFVIGKTTNEKQRCGDNICDEGEIRSCPLDCEEREIVPERNNCEFGCFVDDRCVSYGFRLEKDGAGVYCDIDGELKRQKVDGDKAENDYECVSNSARYGVCENVKEQVGIMNRMFGWLSRWFGWDDLNDEPKYDPIGEKCEQLGGKWDASYEECTEISSEICNSNGGKYLGVSPCRHSKKSGPCIQSFDYICVFN